MFTFFKSDFFHFEFLRLIGVAPLGGADVAECLETRIQIRQDAESWYHAWSRTAKHAENLAKEAVATGDAEGARWAFLRASNYARAAQFFLHIDKHDPRIKAGMEQSISYFVSALPLLDSSAIQVSIPYRDTLNPKVEIQLPGYLYFPTEASRMPGKIPVIINTGGLDSTQEEIYYYLAAGATRRGYAVLTFEGPGQGIVCARDGLTNVPEWEVVTDVVVDWLQCFSRDRPELDLDLDRVAIVGASTGGYFALRAAKNPIFKAAVCIDGTYDFFLVFKQRFPGWLFNGWQSGWLGPGFMNALFGLISRLDFKSRWEFNHLQWAFGVSTTYEALAHLKRYTLRLDDGGEYLRRVQCPVLVTGAAYSDYFPPEVSTQYIYAALDHLPEGKREMWVAKEPGMGGLQAKVAALSVSHQRTCEFLDRHLGIERTALKID
ncbi:alpha/beta-hydrolase [Nemania sp. FL0916]|nr:alpha/beta-hydrolase [Nemania sp. FL0916]